jgi:outer membrane protein assembly factor BamB
MRRVVTGLAAGAAGLVFLFVGNGTAPAYIDLLAGSLAAECKNAQAIALLRVEKVNREKKAITYRKVRDLKGKFPEFAGDTFTHVLGAIPNPDRHRQDVETKDLQNDAILACAEEGKTALFFLGPGGACAICVGHAWYTTRGSPPAGEHWVLRGGADSRLQRLFCGDVDELLAAVTAILDGKARKDGGVPRMVGTDEMVTDRSGPIVRAWGIPFPLPSLWSTHRGNARRTGSDGTPGPKRPVLLWAYKSADHFIAPVVPGTKALFASSLGAFNTPSLRALALDPAVGDNQVHWAKTTPFLRQPIAGAPALLRDPAELLIFGDGFHTDEGSSLRCVRASDGLPLWRLPVPGQLVHFEGTPTEADGKLYVGGGSAGVLCLDPGRVTFEDRERDLIDVQAALEQRRKDLRARYEAEKHKDPKFALPPDESELTWPTPRRIWQRGQGEWHVDAPVAVVADRVLVASASLEGEKISERALLCLKAEDGSVLWKTPLKMNPWAGPTVGPYVLVGCSSIRLDPKEVGVARGEIVALELDTGTVRWRKEVPGGVLSSVAVKAGLAIFTATDGKVRAWDAFTGQEKWAYDAKAPFFAGPAIAKDMVYVADLKGVVHALNLADGTREWRLDLSTEPATRAAAMIYGSPVVHRGRLYLATCNIGERAAPGQNVVVCIGDK